MPPVASSHERYYFPPFFLFRSGFVKKREKKRDSGTCRLHLEYVDVLNTTLPVDYNQLRRFSACVYG